MTTRTWSPYQTAIFNFVETGTGNAIIEAVAGSGKTTTIVEAVKRVSGSYIFLAFGKAIADELASKHGVNARTFHSLCCSAVVRYKGGRVNLDKKRDIIDSWLSGDDARAYGYFISKLVDLAQQTGIGALVEDTEQAWQDIIDHHNLELTNESASYPRAIELARELLQRSCASRDVDFSDMLYIAVKDGVTLPKFDNVFVDEAQDTNAIQRAILRKIGHTGARLIAVGDPAQAIYGFRGADSESMNMIAEEFNAIRLPLTVSYRCPTAVIEYARQWVSHIEAAPGATEGSVNNLGMKWDAKTFAAGDLIVCRTTAPLVTTAYQLLKAGVPATIMGKEIGKGLVALVNKMKARGIDALTEKLEKFTEREVQKAIAKKQESKAEAIQDKTDCIMVLISTLPETDRSIPALIRVIDNLFSDSKAAVVLATIHKAKGLEANNVFWLNRSKCPSKWAKQEWQQEQERNLCYVAATRAKVSLTIIEDGSR